MTAVMPHVIAEAGTNHNGRVETGKALVDAAVAGGAASVKFQMIFPEGLYLPRFFRHGDYVENEVYRRRAATALSSDQFRELAHHCRARGVGFSASVFDARGVTLVDELQAEYIKIASCDLNHSRLIRMAAERGRRVILSTGMGTLGEIEQAVNTVVSTGNQDLALMHCVSVYPCPTELMNLSFIDTLKTAFGFPVGLSDHTENSLAAAIAAAKGATYIEKHITLDRTSEGFDHAYAMEPAAFAGFVQDVRAAAEACRAVRGTAKVSLQEAEVKQRARRGLYAACDIAAGETLTEDHVLTVRPEGPLPPDALASMVGRRAAKSIGQFEPLTWEMVR